MDLHKLFALLMVCIAAGGFVVTSAFTSVEAERTANVNVAGDANALLAIQPIPDPGDSSFVTQRTTEDQTFQISSDNTRASTSAEDLFKITNNGQEPVDVWIATQGGEQEKNATINTSFYIRSEHIVNGTPGNSEVAVSDVNDNPDPKPLSRDIDSFGAFVEGDEDTLPKNTDIVISEVEGDGSEDQSPGTASAVSIAPGDSIRVSFAVEIDNEVPVDTNILTKITIFAINDDDLDADVHQELATSPGADTETGTETGTADT